MFYNATLSKCAKHVHEVKIADINYLILVLDAMLLNSLKQLDQIICHQQPRPFKTRKLPSMWRHRRHNVCLHLRDTRHKSTPAVCMFNVYICMQYGT